MEIMYVGNTSVLHMLDKETRFSAASLLKDVSTKAMWYTFVKRWSTIYTGLSNRIIVDQGSALGKSGVFALLDENSNIELDRTGIEAKSSFGLGER